MKQCKQEFPIAWKESMGLNRLKGQILHSKFSYCFSIAHNMKKLHENQN